MTLFLFILNARQRAKVEELTIVVDMGDVTETKIKRKGEGYALRSIFMHADGMDKLLMALGLIGAIGDGFSQPVVLFVTSRLLNNTGVSKSSGTDSFTNNINKADAFDLFLMIFGFISTVIDGISIPVIIFVSAKLMDDIGGATNLVNVNFTRDINKNALMMCYVACGQWVACFLEGYCWTRTGERQASRTRTSYLKAVLRQDAGYFDLHTTTTSEIITSVSNDTLLIQDVISEKIPLFLRSFSTFLGSYILALLLLWRLALLGFPFVILLIIPGIIHGRALMSIARKMRTEYNKASTIAEQAISSIRNVYAFVGEASTINEYSKALKGTVKLGLRQGLAKGLVIGSGAIVFAIWAFLSYFGSRMVMYHGADGGTVYAIGSAIVVGGITLGSGLSNLKPFSEASAAGERILEVIKRVPKIDSENLEGKILQNVDGELEFVHVEFSYPSRPDSTVFKDLNLKIPSGGTMALVGKSGSGKSTMIALLQRFYDPSKGEVLLDGVAIRKIQLKWLRSQIGLVSQEPALFATSIKENILFGKENADLEEVINAAKASNAHNFICQLPQGYDTQVGERGTQMSGGQKQRIAIARAIIKAPRILLLDEATSALDSGSELIVQQALEKASRVRTTLTIAHRLSTIRNADLIAIISNGQVVKTGTHDELIKDETGLYNSLVKLQATRRNIDDDISSSTNLVIADGDGDGLVENQNTSFSLASMVSHSSSRFSKPLSYVVKDQIVLKERKAPSFWRLLAMNIPEWKQATIGCISAILFGAIQPVYSYAMGSMVAVYFLTDHSDIQAKTRLYVLCFVGLAVFLFLVNICQHYSFGYMGEYLTLRIRQKMLSKMLTFEVGWFDEDENSSGAICSWLDRDASMVRSLVGDRMALVIQTISATIVSCTLGLVISWRLAMVIIAIQPLLVTCLYFKHVLLKSMSKKAIKSQTQSSNLAAESVSNIRTIWAFSSQARILDMLGKAQQGPRKESIWRSWYAGIGLGTCQSLWSCTLALDYWYGGKLISEGYLSPKSLFQTFIILLSTGRVIADAGIMTSDLARGSSAVKSIFAVLDRASLIEPESPKGYKPNPDKLTGQIELHNISFAYPSRPEVMVFENFNLLIQGGKSTALVGQSGSGKSTIIALIERFYDPIKGMVKIDGHDLRTYRLRSLREHIALVSQEPVLFSSTIRENIIYGVKGEVNESDIIKAAKASNAHDFISGLSNGYDTWCGDKGVQLSGGQKQRIAIARATIKKPRILLLDEATSALDSQSEKAVQVALERMMTGKTSVVVAHRLSTIHNCDEIAVLEKGKVVEKGSHSSLLAKGEKGVYYSLINIQTTPIIDSKTCDDCIDDDRSCTGCH